MKRERPVMTVKELADYLGLHPSSIYRMVKQNEGPPWFRMGADYRWNFEDVETWRKERVGSTMHSKATPTLKAVK